MKLTHLEEGRVDTMTIRLVAGPSPADGLDIGTEVAISRDRSTDSTILRHGEHTWLIEGRRGKHARVLDRFTSTNLPRLTWVQNRVDDETLELRIHTFAFELVGIDFKLGIDEKFLEQAKKLHRNSSTLTGCIEWLTNQCEIKGSSPTPSSRFLISGPQNSDDLDAFVLHGHAIRVFVKKIYDEERQDHIWSLQKVTRTGSSDKTSPALCRGFIEFVDNSEASRAQASVLSQLEELRGQRGTSFLELWKTYSRLEFEESLSRARDIGALDYEKWSYTEENQLRFTLKNPKHFTSPFPEIDYLDVSAQRPPFFTASEEELKSLDLSTTPRPDFGGSFNKSASNLARGIIVLDIGEDERKPPKEGVLHVSLLGDQTNRDRREKAREKLQTAQTPIPHLALLLEEGRLPVARPKQIEPISQRVREQVFGGQDPTPRQKAAIYAALNTPDIALIQGPPGTGKTTVIRAIVTRLDELLADEEGDSRKVLLSGFQHEAVQNIVEGLEVHGVPAVKFGGPSGVNGYRDAMGNLETNRLEIINRLKNKIPKDSPVLLSRSIDELHANYILSPHPPAATRALLERVLILAGERLSSSLRSQLREEMESQHRSAQTTSSDPGRDALIARVRALRSTSIAFDDDGPQTAGRLLFEITRGTAAKKLSIALSDEEKALLDRLAFSGNYHPKTDLPALQHLRKRLLTLLIVTDPDRHRRAAVQEKVAALLAKVSAELSDLQRRNGAGLDAVAAEFYDVLDRQPFEYQQAIFEMTPVWGATCQQAASHRLAMVRKEELEYDTVIIDEAARATPLDLFIPMSQAKRRIILVGDHRQLPHLVDRQLEGKLQSELDESQQDDTIQNWFLQKLSESLFEHLRSVLRTRSQNDDFDYLVNLDIQYRTHPLLGDFISRNFYEGQQDSEDGDDAVKLKSGRPPEDFHHELPRFAHKVAAWIDVPHQRGGEESFGTSKARKVEAKILVHHLKRLIDHPAGENLSFGVITYYGGQREILWQELYAQGLATKNESGDYEIAPRYRHLKTSKGLEERLRIGSVDAFQGREFDVVFLSMVRSNSHPDKTVREKRQKFGHLMSPNRLNVSMSRQKRLLIIVGDSTMLDSPHAEGAISPLIRFHRELCLGPHGVVITDE